jgi:hypothetical protein
MKRRKYLLTLSVSGLAGCQENISIESQETSERQQQKEQYENCGETLDIGESYLNESEILNTDRKVIQYQELSEEEKEEFKKALSGGITDFNGTWDPQSFIRYQDEYYRVRISVC